MGHGSSSKRPRHHEYLVIELKLILLTGKHKYLVNNYQVDPNYANQ